VRVAIVIERFGRRGGGSESAAWYLARELGARGVDLSVVCRTALGRIPDGVDAIRVTDWGARLPGRLARFSRMANRVTRDLFDVVHSFARTRHQRVYRVRGGCYGHQLERVYGQRRLHRRLRPRHRAILATERAVFRDPDQIIHCDSHGAAQVIAERHGLPAHRLWVIYDGVDAAQFHPRNREASREPVRRTLGVAGPTALFVGNDWAQKGLDRAIEALAHGPREAELLVAGTGNERPYRARAERLGVEQRIRFLGWRNDIAELHGAADLFVLPARYDPFSHACLEAMASGLPVATTRANGVAELIQQGENGLVFDDDFGSAFHLLDEPRRLARMGAAARRTAEEHSWARHADEVMALYARARL
jgi:UDP-glucose:(heptosyl)LPS alpha-1,3-glucosyltransferase